MNRYLSLLVNTVLFGIGSFSSKLMLVLLLPLYTSTLTEEQFGIAELLNTSVDLLIPILTLGIIEATFRFAIDSGKKEEVLATTSVVIVGGLVVLLALSPAIVSIIAIDHPSLYILLIATAIAKALFSQYIRGIGRVRLFTLSGILDSFVLLMSNALLLYFFRMGIAGYLVSIIVANAATILFLFVVAKLYKDLSAGTISKPLLQEMIKYSVLLIPNSICWWLINSSGRYVVLLYFGVVSAGLYAAAIKLPAMINVFSSIFYKAWQYSSVQEFAQKDSEAFYSTVFKYYSTLVIVGGAGLIAFLPWISKLLLANEFYHAWVYAPFMLLTAVLSCFVSFFGTIYMAGKKNFMGMVSTVSGTVLNIALLFALTPRFGLAGAALAGTISYFAIAMFRIFDTRRIKKVRLEWSKLTASFFALVLQAGLLTFGIPYSKLAAIALFVFVFVIFSRDIAELLRSLYIQVLQAIRKTRGADVS